MRDARFQSCSLNVGVIRIEEDLALSFIQVSFIRSRGKIFNLVCIVKHHTHVADSADTSFGTYRRHAGLDARIAENALFCFSG